MPSRRHHRKSRAGCLTCKKRHVKCDEQRPQCNKCSARSLQCVYESLAAPESSRGGSTSTGARVYSALDLELLHHYCINANASLASSIGLRPYDGLFALPSIAFRFEFVLRAILALAALHLDHLQTQGQNSTIDYAALAAGHINDALPAYRLALHGVTRENCTALLLFSSLLTVYILAMSRNGMNPFHRRLEIVEHELDASSFDLSSWLRLVIGGVTAIRPWVGFILKDAEVGPCLNSELWTVRKTPETNVQAQRDKILAKLERLWNADADEGLIVSRTAITDLSPDAKTALTTTLNSLRNTYLWVTFRTDAGAASTPQVPSPSDYGSPLYVTSSRTILPLFVTSAPDSATTTPGSQNASFPQTRAIELSAILSFLHDLNDGFLLLLQRRHPLTLIIMAHYAVLLQQKNIWWLRGLGEDMHAWIVEELVSQPVSPTGSNDGASGGRWMRWMEWSKSFFED